MEENQFIEVMRKHSIIEVIRNPECQKKGLCSRRHNRSRRSINRTWG